MRVFLISIVFILYTYLLYPLIMLVISRLWQRVALFERELDELPTVTMIIIAFNEEKWIEEKLDNCRGLDYPTDLLEICVISDGSTDRTADILRNRNDIVFIEDIENHGKPHQLNRAIARSASEILVFSDARQMYDRSALSKLIRNFSDKRIGCVSGELVFRAPEDSTGGNIGLYWAYEKMLREAESRIDSTLGVTGAIYAIRRELATTIPDDTILDDIEIPLPAFRKGYRVTFEPEAIAFDNASTEIGAEFKRKTRTLAGNYQLFCRNPWLFVPWENRIFFQTISHKLFRLIVPWAMLALLLASSRVGGAAFAGIFWAQIIGYGLGLSALISGRLRKIKLINLIAVFMTLNAAAIVGLYRYAMGSAGVKWRNK